MAMKTVGLLICDYNGLATGAWLSLGEVTG